eukprot:2943959-Pleurochrysis_carterae.AAC.1
MRSRSPGRAGHRKQLYLLVRKRMMPPPPAALEVSDPNGRRNEGAWTFWYYGPPSFRAPRRAGHRSRLRRARRGYRLCLYLVVRTRLTPPLSHALMNYDHRS